MLFKKFQTLIENNLNNSVIFSFTLKHDFIANSQDKKKSPTKIVRLKLEVGTGFEPVFTVLQTVA